MACDFELPPRIKIDHGAVTNSAETSGYSRGPCTGASTGKKGMHATCNAGLELCFVGLVLHGALFRSTLDGVRTPWLFGRP